MAQFHDGGGIVFDALAYSQPHASTLRFLTSQFENATSALMNAGQAFVEQARQAFEQISGSHAMRTLRAAGRAIRNAWQLDEIRPMRDIGEFQHALPIMQRWIMAEPTTRKLYHQQRIDGYSDSYVDLEPGRIGEEHYDYRRVMDGILVVQETDDEEATTWTATTYMEELLPDDVDLELDQQMDILKAWDWLRAHIAQRGDDPTSRYNAAMS